MKTLTAVERYHAPVDRYFAISRDWRRRCEARDEARELETLKIQQRVWWITIVYLVAFGMLYAITR